MRWLLDKINDRIDRYLWKKYGWMIECDMDCSPDLVAHYYRELAKFQAKQREMNGHN